MRTAVGYALIFAALMLLIVVMIGVSSDGPTPKP